MTVAYMPVPVEDELLFSLLGRHRFHSGFSAAAAHTEHLFGSRSLVVSPELQGRLGNLADRLHRGFGLTADALLNRHTLFGYYTAFQPQDVRELSQQEMISNSASSAFVRLGIAAFKASIRRQIRFCPACQEHQLAQHGECMWLRSHQLPGSLVCPWHEERLCETGVVFDGTARHDFRPPTPAAYAASASPWSAEADVLLREIAVRQTELCRWSRPAHRTQHWKPQYRKGLSRLYLMRSPKQVDQPKLESALRDILGPALPFLPGNCTNLGEGGWPMLMVRAHRKAMHPLFHVLMELAFDRLSDGKRATSSFEVPDTRSKAPLRAKISGDRSTAQFEGETITRLRHAAKKIRLLEPPRRVTFAELERRTLGAGWLRHRRHRLQKAFALGWELSESPQAFRARRVIYWKQRLGPVPVWQILRAAGIRTEYWREAEQLCLSQPALLQA